MTDYNKCIVCGGTPQYSKKRLLVKCSQCGARVITCWPEEVAISKWNRQNPNSLIDIIKIGLQYVLADGFICKNGCQCLMHDDNFMSCNIEQDALYCIPGFMIYNSDSKLLYPTRQTRELDFLKHQKERYHD